ncbi:MAG: tRNA pseudouridine(55) synthase TruB [Acidimicrobiaceae bacterium]|nr:tRNA pseudouridine(55) synthase TruB [Acidimicrobiaceae bacterium]
MDKPTGVTSHDVVAQVRKLFNERRVGHAGTLDPMATGLLVLAVGPSTRLLRFAQSEVKRYCGTVMFGVATDSLDADGTVVDVVEVPALSQLTVQGAAESMLGTQLQVPPMVSAIKIGGRRLHELARQGIEVVREPREISISEFRVMPTSDRSTWSFEVECSVGTYVRVLLSDLALKLATVGHLTSLRRLSSGLHHVSRAKTLEEISAMLDNGEDPLGPPSLFTASLEDAVIGPVDQDRMRKGQQLDLAGSFLGAEVAALDSSGKLVGVLKRRGERWQPEVVLVSESGPTHG